MRKTNTNLSNYDAFRKYSVEEIGNMLGIGKTKKFQQYIDLLHKVVSGQEKTPETRSFWGPSGEAQTGFEPVDTGVADHCLL